MSRQRHDLTQPTGHRTSPLASAGVCAAVLLGVGLLAAYWDVGIGLVRQWASDDNYSHGLRPCGRFAKPCNARRSTRMRSRRSPPSTCRKAIAYTYTPFPFCIPANGIARIDANVGAIPEPTTLLLLGSSVACGAYARRRRLNKSRVN